MTRRLNLKGLLFAILSGIVFSSCSSAQGEKDCFGLTFGSSASKVQSVLVDNGWNNVYEKRAYSLYKCSQFMNMENPSCLVFFSGKGTGSFSYSNLSVNLYDDSQLDVYNEFFASQLAKYNLSLTLKKEFSEGKVKTQINKDNGGSLICIDYNVSLYQKTIKPKAGKDNIELLQIELYMYDAFNSRYFKEYQLYYLSPGAQKTVSKQMFETEIN